MKRRLFIALLLALAGPMRAEVPPLSDEERASSASHIVVATVKRVDSKVKAEGPDFSDRIYTVTLSIHKVEKGSLKPGRTLKVTYWQAEKRPEEYVGPSGQYKRMEPGMKVRAWVSGTELLTPNGWEKLSQ